MKKGIADHQHKYQQGQVVYALEHPEIALIIRRYIDRIYYCQLQKEPVQKDVVYFENELFSLDDE